MHENNVNLLRKEAQRLLLEEIGFLKNLQQVPHVLSAPAAVGDEQTFDFQSVPRKIEMLEDEARKLDDLELVIAVVGTMKAGKSTTINAIVGAEVLPNRNRPMTALPTLIRHTPGVKQPRLTLGDTVPLDRLVEKLKEAATAKRRDTVKDDPALIGLLDRILDGESFSQGSGHHEGADAIFDFLKGLNDLVRLSTALGVEFPFSDYSTVVALPLIEVEFAHLRDQDQVQGRLTLLDTPGPNEAGQTHLRAMLRDQLQKASGVLAVLDYTQLKSDADDEVRLELAKIASVTENRLYVLVNKFDQKDRHGDDADQVRNYVSSQLMERIIPKERVYPVSSKLGYLSGRAMNEIDLHGVLPDPADNAWVEDFAEEALGRRWQDRVADKAAVERGIDDLWEDSLFSEPLTRVIEEGYRKAAVLAVASVVDKMAELAKDASNFVGVRGKALKQEAGEIQRAIQSVQDDIDAISRHEKAVADDLKKSLESVSDGIQGAHTAAKLEVERVFDNYFKEGKRIEGEQDRERKAAARGKKKKKKKAEREGSSENLAEGVASRFERTFEAFVGREAKASQDDDIDFDPESPIIKFDKNRDAEKFLKGIEKSVENALKQSERYLRNEIKSQLNEFNGMFQGNVEMLEVMVDGLKNNNSEISGFDLIISVPAVTPVEFDLSMSDVLDDAIMEKTESRTRERRKDSVMGKIWGFFNTDVWGWESYNVDVDVYQIDLNKLQKNVKKGVAETFGVMRKTVVSDIEGKLTAQADSFFATLKENIEHIRGDLIASLNDKQHDQQAQQALAQELGRLGKNVPGLLKDSEALAKQVKPLLNP